MGVEPITKIGTFEFKGVEIPVYHDIYTGDQRFLVSWQMKNPTAFYDGIFFMADDGTISYPEGATPPPRSTSDDSQMLPKFIIVGNKNFLDNEETRKKLLEHLDTDYHRKNS